jgi:nucleoside-diphosphate-sugar epimerase
MVLLSGDVSAAGLGLDAAAQKTLSAQIDLVLHCAAVTDFNASEEVYRAVNIGGVQNIAALFSAQRILHVSTAYVCGLKNGAVAEQPRDDAYGFANGYEQSKAAGEGIVRATGKRAVIARPSIILGTYDEGCLRSFDTFYQAFRLIAEGQITKLPASPDATLDFVPIDHVAGGLMDIIEHWDNAAGQTIHLSSGSPVSMAMLADAIGHFAHLHRPELVAPADFCPTKLPPLERRLYRHVAAFYSSYFQRSPLFETACLAAIGGRICPPMDANALARMIAYCIARGFIRSPD